VDVPLQLDERGDVGGPESGVAAADDVLEVLGRDLGGRDVERQDVEGKINEREVLPGLPLLGGGNLMGNVQTAVGGEALEDDLLEGELLFAKRQRCAVLSPPADGARDAMCEKKGRVGARAYTAVVAPRAQVALRLGVRLAGGAVRDSAVRHGGTRLSLEMADGRSIVAVGTQLLRGRGRTAR
jgi:hypothetical protein